MRTTASEGSGTTMAEHRHDTPGFCFLCNKAVGPEEAGREFYSTGPDCVPEARVHVLEQAMVADAADLLRQCRRALRAKYLNTLLDDAVARRYNDAQLLKQVVLLVEAIDEWLLRL